LYERLELDAVSVTVAEAGNPQIIICEAVVEITGAVVIVTITGVLGPGHTPSNSST
jgi:hypothetical protein